MPGNAEIRSVAMQQRSRRRATAMTKRYCDEESVFAYIWRNADEDGLWDGDALAVVAEFDVSEDEAYDALSELCDRNRLQRIGEAKHIVTRWPEREEPGEEESAR
jgi:hypothetical protein